MRSDFSLNTGQFFCRAPNNHIVPNERIRTCSFWYFPPILYRPPTSPALSIERFSWPSSPIFGPDMFGSALGSAEDQFQISDGWFAGITSAYDPDDVLADEDISPAHSPYGYVGAPYNYQVILYVGPRDIFPLT